MSYAVAVIGAGARGVHLTANLVKAKYEVRGFDDNLAKLVGLIARGGWACSTLKEAVTSAEIVLTALPATHVVEEVLTADHGILRHARPDTLWIDISAVRPDTAARLADLARAHGLRPVDAPISSDEISKTDFMIAAGGRPADVQAALPLLTTLGARVIHAGSSGCGQAVKASDQLLVDSDVEMAAEALRFLDARGIDIEVAVANLAGRPADGLGVGDIHNGQRREPAATPAFAPGRPELLDAPTPSRLSAAAF